MAATGRQVPRSGLLAGWRGPSAQGKGSDGGAGAPLMDPDRAPGRRGAREMQRRREDRAVPQGCLSAAGPLAVRQQQRQRRNGRFPARGCSPGGGRSECQAEGGDEAAGRFPGVAGRPPGLPRSGPGARSGLAPPARTRGAPARPEPGTPPTKDPIRPGLIHTVTEAGRAGAHRSTPHGGLRARSRPDQNGIRCHGVRIAPVRPRVGEAGAAQEGRGARPRRSSRRR